MKRWRTQQGQSSLETLLTIGLIVIPLGTGVMIWARVELTKSESAFLSFRNARIRMIRLQKPVTERDVTLYPLEDLDQDKRGLLPSTELNRVLQLWDLRF